MHAACQCRRGLASDPVACGTGRRGSAPRCSTWGAMGPAQVPPVAGPAPKRREPWCRRPLPGAGGPAWERRLGCAVAVEAQPYACAAPCRHGEAAGKAGGRDQRAGAGARDRARLRCCAALSMPTGRCAGVGVGWPAAPVPRRPGRRGSKPLQLRALQRRLAWRPPSPCWALHAPRPQTPQLAGEPAPPACQPARSPPQWSAGDVWTVAVALPADHGLEFKYLLQVKWAPRGLCCLAEACVACPACRPQHWGTASTAAPRRRPARGRVRSSSHGACK